MKGRTMRGNHISMLQDTLDILVKGSYQLQGRTIRLKLSPSQMEEVEVYLPEDVQRVCNAKDFMHNHVHGRCEYGCENIDSFSLAQKRTAAYSSDPGKKKKPVLVLNLANPVRPGGGVRNGAKAQEEDLCRKSSLLLSLESWKAETYYGYNRSLHTYLGSDAVMLHPQVEIIRDENGELLPETILVAVMSCAAPMLIHGHAEGLTQAQYEKLMYDRITGMLKVAAYRGYSDLVLGAFGCGAFENDARVVSDLFCEALKAFEYDGMRADDVFRWIRFAVLCHSDNLYNYKEFSRNFDHFDQDEKRTGENQCADSGMAPV